MYSFAIESYCWHRPCLFVILCKFSRFGVSVSSNSLGYALLLLGSYLCCLYLGMLEPPSPNHGPPLLMVVWRVRNKLYNQTIHYEFMTHINYNDILLNIQVILCILVSTLENMHCMGSATARAGALPLLNYKHNLDSRMRLSP